MDIHYLLDTKPHYPNARFLEWVYGETEMRVWYVGDPITDAQLVTLANQIKDEISSGKAQLR